MPKNKSTAEAFNEMREAFANPTQAALREVSQAVQAITGFDEDEEEVPPPDMGEPVASPARLLDLAVFYKALDVLGQLRESYEGGDRFDLDPVGQRLANNFFDELALNVDKILGPVFEIHGFKKFKRQWVRLARPNRTPERHMARGDLVVNIIAQLRKKPQHLKNAFPENRDFLNAKRLGAVQDADWSVDALKALLEVRLMGSMTLTRRYVKNKAREAGVEMSAFDEAVSETEAAEDLGKQIREVDTKLLDTSPIEVERQEALKGERERLLSDVTAMAMESASPDNVINTAAAAAVVKHQYTTEAGKRNGLSPDQEEAMKVRGPSIIAAGAGSGKTRTLSAKVAYHVEELGVPVGQVIATSFSKKSALELVEKVKRAAVNGEGMFDEPGSEDGFGTTHSITYRMCKRHLPGGDRLRVLENETKLLRMAMAQVTLRHRGDLPPAPEPEGFFSSPVATRVPEEVDEEAPQPEGMEEEAGPVNNYEDALRAALAWWKNTGNTRDHVKGWGIKPSYRASVTGFLTDLIEGGKPFSRLSGKQKGWLKSIIAGAGIPFDPAGGGVMGAIRAAAADDGAVIEGNFYKQPANQWFNLGMGEKAWSKEGGIFPRPVGPRQIGLFISNMKGKLVTPSQAAKLPSAQAHPMFVAAYAAYEWLKSNDQSFQGQITFDDMLIKASAALISNPTLLAQYQNRFKVILVDEAQDLNPAQHLFFGLLAGYRDPKTQQPFVDENGVPTGQMTADTFCFIGDDKQAIYEFRGAEPNEFIDLDQVHGFTKKVLETNYRSGGVIVDSANRLIWHNEKQIEMVCRPMDKKRQQGIVEYVDVEDNKDGAAWTAQLIKDQTEDPEVGAEPQDFGIACRTNAEIYDFVAECLKKQLPFKLPKKKFNVFNNKFSKAIIGWLEFSTAPASDTKTMNKLVTELHRAPNFNLKDVFNDRIKQVAKDRGTKSYYEALVNGGWNEIYDQAWRNRNAKQYMEALEYARTLGEKHGKDAVHGVLYNIKGTVMQDGEWVQASMVEDAIYNAKRDPEIMDALMGEREGEAGSIEDKMSQITDEEVSRLALARAQPVIGLFEGFDDIDAAMDYVKQLQGRESAEAKDDTKKEDFLANAVQIDTVHGWKGLECKRMFVPMPAGTFPHVLSEDNPDDLASERRLAYVAITRAEERCTIIAPKINMMGKEAGPSSFVGEACIPPQGQGYAPGPFPEMSKREMLRRAAEEEEAARKRELEVEEFSGEGGGALPHSRDDQSQMLDESKIEDIPGEPGYFRLKKDVEGSVRNLLNATYSDEEIDRILEQWALDQMDMDSLMETHAAALDEGRWEAAESIEAAVTVLQATLPPSSDGGHETRVIETEDDDEDEEEEGSAAEASAEPAWDDEEHSETNERAAAALETVQALLGRLKKS